MFAVTFPRAIAPLLPDPAGGRHVPTRREGVPDIVQHVRGARVSPVERAVRQRSQQHAQGDVPARKRPHDARPDLPHVLDTG